MIGHCKLVGYLALHGQFRLQTFQSSYKAKWPHITGTFSNFELKIFKRHRISLRLILIFLLSKEIVQTQSECTCIANCRLIGSYVIIGFRMVQKKYITTSTNC